MVSKRGKGSSAAALALAGSLAAGAANADPITLCANVDFGADHAAASMRSEDSSVSLPASFEVALDLAPRPTHLSIAPLAISFRRWDENLLGTLSDVPVAPVDPARQPTDPGR
jgi:hypothetical protein